MSDLKEVFSRIQSELSRGGLWSRGGEIGTLDPAEALSRDFRVLITRLSSYEDTSLSFTHNILYALCAERGWFPDWAFLPTAQDRSVYAANDIPWLFGIQSKMSVRDFSLVALSNSISQETGNIVWFLKNSGVSLLKSERMAEPDLPLIILGGANAGSASVLFHPDPLVDGIFVGEDLETIARLFGAVKAGREKGLSKREILESLEGVGGFFQSDRPRPVKKFNPRTIEPTSLYGKMPVNWGDGNPGKAVLPISDGCAGFCSFCNESFARKPYRESSVKDLLDQSRALKAETGADKIDLFSFNFNMHKGFYELIEGLLPLFRDIGLKSQRFDSIAEDPRLIEIEKALGKSVFTCGLEGISDRMRRFLNKNLDDAQVRTSVEALIKASVREIKVFLIATGREDLCDFEEWERFLAWAQTLRTPQGKEVRIVFSITPLVRFPHTPLEFEPTPSLSSVKGIIKKILDVTQKAGFECRQAASVEESLFCDQLVRADRSEIYDAFKKTILETGFIYEREVSDGVYHAFMKKIDASVFSPAKNASAPWALLDMSISRKYLETQYERNAAYAQIYPDAAVLCGKGRPHLTFPAFEELKAKIAKARKDESDVELACHFGDRYANIPREYPSLYIARALMKVEPLLVPLYRGYGSSFWQLEAEKAVPVWGKDRIVLKFKKAGCDLLSSRGSDFWSRVNNELSRQDISIEGLVALSTTLATASAAGAGMSGVQPFLCMLRMESPVDFNPDYLTGNGLKHTYVRIGEGRFSYQLTKESLKKGMIVSLEIDRSKPGLFAVSLVPGPKFNLFDFLKNAFAKSGWRQIRVEAQ